jgi:hypothetical protein
MAKLGHATPNPDLQAAAKANGLSIAGGVTIRAAAGDGATGAPKYPTVDMVLYTGDSIRQPWSDTPLVIDLKGFECPPKVAVNWNHDTYSPDSLLGQTTSTTNDGKQITLAAELLNTASPICQHVVEMAKAGFEWQASVGGDVDETEYFSPREKVSVNGRTFEGPILVVRSGRLREATICQQGADPGTSAAIAAKANGVPQMSKPVNGNPEGNSEPTNVAAGAPLAAAAGTPATPPPAAPIVAASGADGAPAGDDLATQILKANLAKANAEAEAAKLELARVQGLQAHRGSFGSAPAGHIAGQSMNAAGLKVMGMAAALCMAAGMSDDALHRRFKEAELTAGNDQRMGMGIQEFFLRAARAAGWSSPENKMHIGNAKDVIQAAFSHHDIPTTLSASYGKFVLDSWQSVVDSDPWKLIHTPKMVNDLKQIPGVRTMGDFSFKRATNSGKLEDAKLIEDTRTIKADLWGRCTAWTLEDFLNDDTGRFNELGSALGDGAGMGFLEDFYTTLLTGIAASYYITVSPAAGNALSLTSLKAAKALIERQKNTAGKPIVVQGRLILVPPELDVVANDLMKAGSVVTGESKTLPSANSLAGRYAVASTQFLTSSAGWGLVGGRGGLAPMQVAWLNGVMAPTIVSADPAPDTLGFILKGWMAWGCRNAEKQSMVWQDVA